METTLKESTMRQVDGETLRRTTKCQHSFFCLGGCGWQLCPAGDQASESGGVVTLERLRPHCKYVRSSDEISTCTCPTRHELRETYGL
jgi:hypothetical protein